MADCNCLHLQIGRQTFFVCNAHTYDFRSDWERVRVDQFSLSDIACIRIINNELMAKIIDLIIYIFIVQIKLHVHQVNSI